jgi:4a-hydroxytetrahydrobiopterin dehydratase
MAKLDEMEIKKRLENLKGWKVEGIYLVKHLKFENFVSAVNFINKIVPIAEELEHHPDLELKNYNELIIRITTHDEGGITELDFELAKKIDELIL